MKENEYYKNINVMLQMFYDEAGKIDRDFFALTEPFTSQDTNFRTGKNLNIKCFPRQLPNQILYSSSAESMDSQLYDQYKMCAMKMIAGDDDYFVCDISCELSLHPMKDGKPYMPLLDQAKVDDAIKKNSYRAQREYFNKFDLSGGQDALIKRTTIIANSFSYHPEFKNEDNESIYVITYDPSSKIDNSFILISKLIEDKEKGFMLKIVAAYNLRKKAESGKLISMQKPEQIEKLKEILLRYNGNNVDYDNIARIIIDAGSGGGGFDISQFLLRDWVDFSGKRHLGLIDLNDKYLAEEKNKFPGAIDKLTLANFTADKVKMYTNCQDMINQGLVMFPKSLNFNNEMEIELEDSEGKITFAYEPMDEEEVRILTEIDLLKEELIGIQKMKNNGVVRYDTLPSKKAQGMHDDRSDCCAMACHFLANLRKDTLLNVEVKTDNKFEKLFSHSKGIKSNFVTLNPNQANPFLNEGPNPFLR